MKYSIIQSDIIEWCKQYDGPKFHAIFTDAPYHLTSITKRFGQSNSTPAKADIYKRASRGFMGQIWDGGEIAFNPETWAAMAEHLYPGGFVMSYGGSRGWHRLACAMEDAGLIIHPTIFGFCYGSGFPKATRVKQDGERVPEFEGYRYGLQAQKPALEPIIVAQKPYKGRPVDCITETGAGVWWIDGGRISGNWTWGTQTDIRNNGYGNKRPSEGDIYDKNVQSHPSGRWPSNFVLVHHPECRRVGVKQIKGNSSNENEYKRNGLDFRFRSEGGPHYADSNGMETIPDWHCHPDCPVRNLELQAGTRKSDGIKEGSPRNHDNCITMAAAVGVNNQFDASEGSAARFFFQAHWAYEVYEQLNSTNPVFYTSKPSSKEREAGLSDLPKKTRNRVNKGGYERDPKWAPTKRHNIHPTVKSIALNKYFSTLLLPPEQYAPRRVLVPFAGVASEMIGCLLAGWNDITGVELTPEYIPIAEARLKWWAEQMQWGHTDVETILSFISSNSQDSDEAIQLSLLEQANV